MRVYKSISDFFFSFLKAAQLLRIYYFYSDHFKSTVEVQLYILQTLLQKLHELNTLFQKDIHHTCNEFLYKRGCSWAMRMPIHNPLALFCEQIFSRSLLLRMPVSSWASIRLFLVCRFRSKKLVLGRDKSDWLGKRAVIFGLLFERNIRHRD